MEKDRKAADDSSEAQKAAPELNDKEIWVKLRRKISEIKTGRLMGSNWNIEDANNFERIWGRGLDGSRVDLRLKAIMPFVERCWAEDPKALAKLDQNPWGKHPLNYIRELLPPHGQSSHAPSQR